MGATFQVRGHWHAGACIDWCSCTGCPAYLSAIGSSQPYKSITFDEAKICNILVQAVDTLQHFWHQRLQLTQFYIQHCVSI